jgi:hypothetical protein
VASEALGRGGGIIPGMGGIGGMGSKEGPIGGMGRQMGGMGIFELELALRTHVVRNQCSTSVIKICDYLFANTSHWPIGLPIR